MMLPISVLISLLLAHILPTNALPSLQTRDGNTQAESVSATKCPRHGAPGAATSDANNFSVPSDSYVSHDGDIVTTFHHFDNDWILLDNARQLEVESLEDLLSRVRARDYPSDVTSLHRVGTY